MIDREQELALTRQAELLRVSRSGLYYRPRPMPAAELAVMHRLDELHLGAPFADSRMLRDLLRLDGVAIGRGRMVTLMRSMGIEALYRRPNTSKPAPGHRIYPYLLRGMTVGRTAGAMDIICPAMARSFAIMKSLGFSQGDMQRLFVLEGVAMASPARRSAGCSASPWSTACRRCASSWPRPARR